MSADSLMSILFWPFKVGPGKPPEPPKIGPTPEEQARASAQALALRQRQGRASTILTGPSAVPTPTNPVGNLLGL